MLLLYDKCACISKEGITVRASKLIRATGLPGQIIRVMLVMLSQNTLLANCVHTVWRKIQLVAHCA